MRCKSLEPIATAVAHPFDEMPLSGAMEVPKQGLIIPILVGPRAKIQATAKSAGIDLSNSQIIDTPHSDASANKAVELLRDARAELLIKGGLHTTN